MRKIIIILVSILYSLCVNGQDKNQNYTISTTYKQPTSTSVSDPDINVANVQVSYYDGLGRPIQQIAHKQSNTGKDIITHVEYDVYGRQIKEYLPYVSTSASLSFLPGAQTDLSSFYASPSIATTGNPSFESTLNPFSERQLENSPLNRVFKQAAQGDPWAMGNGKEIKFDYQTNSATEVKLFKSTATWNATFEIYDISITQEGNYQENQLYKTITKDENWVSGNNNTTEEFKDKQGKVVLKRTFNNNIAHDTYYVYDQYGNLTYVLPPLAEGSVSDSSIENLGYQYKYDKRNRLVAKKLPGKQWEYIIYNKVDKPVATGPVLNPWGDGTYGWLITKYDPFDRVVYTAWYNGREVSEEQRKNYQQEQNNNQYIYENYFHSINYEGIVLDYTNRVMPLVSFKLLTINYYDDYNYAFAPSSLPAPIEGQTPAENVKGLTTGSWVRVLDSPTNTNAEVSYTIYDYKYRPIHTKTTNHLGGYTKVDMHLDWAGKTLYTLTKHKRTNADIELAVKDVFEYSSQDKLVLHKQQINSLPEQLISKNTYDELGQLISKNVGGTDITGATSLQNVDYSYNIRGWLKTINDVNTIGTDLFAFKINYNEADTATDLYNGNISETFWKSSSDNKLRKYDYSYDHLNRLLQADYSKEGSTTFNSYLELLTYDKNGNIQTLLRNGNMDTDGYTFENPIDNLTYLYDTENKNQLLRVFDATSNPQGFKDDTDGTNIDVDISEAPDYEYDDNGNMISDTNKGVTNIVYNHLNLPVEIIFPHGKITYLYNAIGQKISKRVKDFITTGDNLTEYMSGGFQYKDNKLQFFPHAEGYVNATLVEVTCITCKPITITYTTSYDYVFNFTDHLGNIRLSYTKDPNSSVPKIIEENHYYPFGLKHSGYNSDAMMYSKNSSGAKALKGMPTVVKPSYNYKYNGKEYQDELGLNMYDYHARNYDPAIGRWMNIDPKAENSRRWTPYNYAYNNPMYFIDPDGMQADDWIKKSGTNSYVWDENVTKESETPEGYEYVGKNISDVHKDFNSNNNWFERNILNNKADIDYASYYSAKYEGMINRFWKKGIDSNYKYDFNKHLLHNYGGFLQAGMDRYASFEFDLVLPKTGQEYSVTAYIDLIRNNKTVVSYDKIGTVATSTGSTINNAISFNGLDSNNNSYPIMILEFSSQEALDNAYFHLTNRTDIVTKPSKPVLYKPMPKIKSKY